MKQNSLDEFLKEYELYKTVSDQEAQQKMSLRM